MNRSIRDSFIIRLLLWLFVAQPLLISGAFSQLPVATASSTGQSNPWKAMSIKECEDGNCTTWLFFGTEGHARMPSQSEVNLRVTSTDPNNIEIERFDITGQTAGSRLYYTGTLHGVSLGGEIWTEPGRRGEERGHWTGTLESTAEGIPRTIRSCAQHNFTLTWNNDHYDAIEDGSSAPGPRFTIVSFNPDAVNIHRTQKGAAADYIGRITSEGVIEGTQKWHDDSGRSWQAPFRLTYGAAFDSDCKGTPPELRPRTQKQTSDLAQTRADVVASGGEIPSGSNHPTEAAGVSGAVFQIGDGIGPPVLIRNVEPEYSEQARKAKYEGTVVLSLVVDTEGRPRNIQVVRPIGLGLDEKAVEAIKKWRFKPGTKDGQAVNVRVSAEVSFQLK